jgi:hypothetical protein
VEHAILAFRPVEGALVGGYRTHDASIRDGIVTFQPSTFVDGERRRHAAVTFETTAIRGDSELLAGGATGTRLENGRVLIERDAIVEELRNEPDGLHQEWRFTTAPEITGDLAVEVAVDGYKFTGQTAGGLHFAAADGAVGVRYSNAIWIDSAGAEWPIAAAYVDGQIRMTVPSSVIEQTRFPAVLDPTVSSEVAADTPVTGPTGANQMHTSIAFGGGMYLVVWDDARDSVDVDIWATRLDTAGTILDPLGIRIAATAGSQTNPAVAYDGSRFVVAWEDFKVSGGTEADIVAAAVSTSGAVTSLGSVASTAASETKPAIAGRSGGTLLTWNAGGTLSGAVSSSSFGAPFTIATGTVVERAGVAADPAGNYLVTYSSATDLFGQFVTPTGALSGAAFAVSAASGTQSTSAATFDGTNFDVVWVNNRLGINVYGTAVSTTGTVLNTRVEGTSTVGGVAITTAAENQEFPSIACQASGCLVVWQDRRNLATASYDIYGQLVNLDFTLNGTELVISGVTGQQNTPVTASSGTGFFAAWQDLRDNNAFTTFGTTISSAGSLGTAAPIGTGNNRESAPSLGRAKGNYGLFWTDSRSFGNDIRFVRFSPSGTKLDSTSLVASAATYAQLAPSASTDLGTNSLVVWSDTRGGSNKDIYAARVALDTGTVLDSGGIAVTTAANDQLVPDVASNGSVALVVWQDRRNGAFDIYGALVDANGAVTVPDIVISNAASDQVRPAVAWDPASSQFIVVWQDLRSGTQYSIYGARVTATGTVLDASGVQISNGAVGQFTPAIASTTAGTFVVWQDRRNSPNVNIWGTRLSASGALTVLDSAGIQVASGTGRQSAPKITTIGTSYLVVWVDARAGQDDIYGQQLDADGAAFGTEFVVTATSDPENGVTVLGAGGTGTSARVAYETHRLDTARVATRVITAQAGTGSVCSGPSQCITGFCVDGYCCDSACGGNHVPASGTTAGDCHGCANRFTGQPNGTCAPLPATTVCRNYASTYCDLREYCDGVNFSCPPDIGRREGLACNMSTNNPPGTGTGTCPSASAPGPHFCQ